MDTYPAKVSRQEDRLHHGIDAADSSDEDDAHQPMGYQPSLWGFVQYVIISSLVGECVALFPYLGPREYVGLADGLFD